MRIFSFLTLKRNGKVYRKKWLTLEKGSEIRNKLRMGSLRVRVSLALVLFLYDMCLKENKYNWLLSYKKTLTKPWERNSFIFRLNDIPTYLLTNCLDFTLHQTNSGIALIQIHLSRSDLLYLIQGKWSFVFSEKQIWIPLTLFVSEAKIEQSSSVCC